MKPASPFFLILFLVFCQGIIAQNSTNQINTNIDLKVHIKGHPFEQYIDLDYLRNGFDLLADDSSYKVESFTITWDSAMTIIANVVKGNRVIPSELKYGTLKNLSPGSILAIDRIQVSKSGTVYNAPSIIAFATDKFRLNTINDSLAKTQIYIEGYRNNSFIPLSAFSKPLRIVSWDSSYRVISLMITFYHRFGQEEVPVELNGDTLDPTNAGYLHEIHKLRINDGFDIEAKVEKNGRTYAVPIYMMPVRDK